MELLLFIALWINVNFGTELPTGALAGESPVVECGHRHRPRGAAAPVPPAEGASKTPISNGF